MQLESRWSQAGQCLHRQHCLTVGCPDWRLWPEISIPLTHPETAVPPQRHVSDQTTNVTWSDRPFRCWSPLKNFSYLIHPDQWQADILCWFIQTIYFCVLGTRYLYVPWSRPQSCWLCRTPNMLSCLWTMTQISMWWLPLTDGASTSTLATPKERWVSVSPAAFLIQHLFTSLRSKTAQVVCTVLWMTCSVVAVNLHLLLSHYVLTDPGVEHKHAGVGGVLQSDHWHQQHNRHQVHWICAQGQVRGSTRFSLYWWTNTVTQTKHLSSVLSDLVCFHVVCWTDLYYSMYTE